MSLAANRARRKTAPIEYLMNDVSVTPRSASKSKNKRGRPKGNRLSMHDVDLSGYAPSPSSGHMRTSIIEQRVPISTLAERAKILQTLSQDVLSQLLDPVTGKDDISVLKTWQTFETFKRNTFTENYFISVNEVLRGQRPTSDTARAITQGVRMSNITTFAAIIQQQRTTVETRGAIPPTMDLKEAWKAFLNYVVPFESKLRRKHIEHQVDLATQVYNINQLKLQHTQRIRPVSATVQVEAVKEAVNELFNWKATVWNNRVETSRFSIKLQAHFEKLAKERMAVLRIPVDRLDQEHPYERFRENLMEFVQRVWDEIHSGAQQVDSSVDAEDISAGLGRQAQHSQQQIQQTVATSPMPQLSPNHSSDRRLQQEIDLINLDLHTNIDNVNRSILSEHPDQSIPSFTNFFEEPPQGESTLYLDSTPFRRKQQGPMRMEEISRSEIGSRDLDLDHLLDHQHHISKDSSIDASNVFAEPRQTEANAANASTANEASTSENLTSANNASTQNRENRAAENSSNSRLRTARDSVLGSMADFIGSSIAHSPRSSVPPRLKQDMVRSSLPPLSDPKEETVRRASLQAENAAVLSRAEFVSGLNRSGLPFTRRPPLISNGKGEESEQEEETARTWQEEDTRKREEEARREENEKRRRQKTENGRMQEKEESRRQQEQEDEIRVEEETRIRLENEYRTRIEKEKRKRTEKETRKRTKEESAEAVAEPERQHLAAESALEEKRIRQEEEVQHQLSAQERHLALNLSNSAPQESAAERPPQPSHQPQSEYIPSVALPRENAPSTQINSISRPYVQEKVYIEDAPPSAQAQRPVFENDPYANMNPLFFDHNGEESDGTNKVDSDNGGLGRQPSQMSWESGDNEQITPKRSANGGSRIIQRKGLRISSGANTSNRRTSRNDRQAFDSDNDDEPPSNQQRLQLSRTGGQEINDIDGDGPQPTSSQLELKASLSPKRRGEISKQLIVLTSDEDEGDRPERPSQPVSSHDSSQRQPSDYSENISMNRGASRSSMSRPPQSMPLSPPRVYAESRAPSIQLRSGEEQVTRGYIQPQTKLFENTRQSSSNEGHQQSSSDEETQSANKENMARLSEKKTSLSRRAGLGSKKPPARGTEPSGLKTRPAQPRQVLPNGRRVKKPMEPFEKELIIRYMINSYRNERWKFRNGWEKCAVYESDRNNYVVIPYGYYVDIIRNHGYKGYYSQILKERHNVDIKDFIRSYNVNNRKNGVKLHPAMRKTAGAYDADSDADFLDDTDVEDEMEEVRDYETQSQLADSVRDIYPEILDEGLDRGSRASFAGAIRESTQQSSSVRAISTIGKRAREESRDQSVKRMRSSGGASASAVASPRQISEEPDWLPFREEEEDQLADVL